MTGSVYGDSAAREIARRGDRAQRLLARLDLPAGMTYLEFLEHPDVADLDLDFVTASQMYDAYAGVASDGDERARRLLGSLGDAPLGGTLRIPRLRNLLPGGLEEPE